jgi:tRNA pseudouridine32 synthase/23S rRNA pseudouridine746 synthase
LFKHGRISKTYWAVVEGGPVEDEGTIEMPLGRLNAERGWWQKPDPEGQVATTKWKVLGRSLVTSPLVGDVDSPLFCGEGLGVGVSPKNTARVDPPPRPSPARGEREKNLTWLALEPVTGRTHQLRVHAAAMGWPIVGDNIYGTQASLRRLRNEQYLPRFGEPKLHLHSRELVIPISKNKDPVRVVAPAPAHLHERLRACGWNGE